MIIDGVRNMKRLCAILLFISIVMTGCTAGHPGGSTSAESSTSSAAKAELAEYTSESLGIRFELDSDWIVDEKPLEPSLDIAVGTPMVGVTFYIVQGYVDPAQYTSGSISAWLKALYSAIEVSPLQSGQTGQGLSYLTTNYICKYFQQTNEKQDILFREFWYWVNLSEDAVLVIRFGRLLKEESDDQFRTFLDQIAQLVDSVQRVGEPIGYQTPDYLLPGVLDDYDLNA